MAVLDLSPLELKHQVQQNRAEEGNAPGDDPIFGHFSDINWRRARAPLAIMVQISEKY